MVRSACQKWQSKDELFILNFNVSKKFFIYVFLGKTIMVLNKWIKENTNAYISTTIETEESWCKTGLDVLISLINPILSAVWVGAFFKLQNQGCRFLKHAEIFSHHAKTFEANLLNFSKTLNITCCTKNDSWQRWQKFLGCKKIFAA